MMMWNVTLPGMALVVCVAGCAPEPLGEDIPNQPADMIDSSDGLLPSESKTGGLELAEPREDSTREFGGKLRLTIPGSWTESEMTAMQRSVLLAKYTMDGDVEITVSSARGGIDANFRRWDGQFVKKEKDEDNIDFGSATARVLTLSGDFSPGFGRPDRTNWSMLGAAFPAVPDDFYVKLTGPADRVKAVESEFRELVKTAEFTH